jgi:SUKH-4 immunity protein
VTTHLYSADYVKCVHDERAREFLVKVGLPTVPGVFTASELRSGHGSEAPIPAAGMLRIGYGVEGEGYYYVNCSSAAITYTESYEGSTYLVNSSPQSFADCLDIFQVETSRTMGTMGTNPARLEEAANSIGAAIEAIDSAAMRDDPGFWRSLLFDVANGDYSGDE